MKRLRAFSQRQSIIDNIMRDRLSTLGQNEVRRGTWKFPSYVSAAEKSEIERVVREDEGGCGLSERESGSDVMATAMALRRSVQRVVQEVASGGGAGPLGPVALSRMLFGGQWVSPSSSSSSASAACGLVAQPWALNGGVREYAKARGPKRRGSKKGKRERLGLAPFDQASLEKKEEKELAKIQRIPATSTTGNPDLDDLFGLELHKLGLAEYQEQVTKRPHGESALRSAHPPALSLPLLPSFLSQSVQAGTKTMFFSSFLFYRSNERTDSAFFLSAGSMGKGARGRPRSCGSSPSRTCTSSGTCCSKSATAS